jgi:hypothetical protein
MTTNERRDSAEKKASDDTRDLNSFARGFTSNEEGNNSRQTNLRVGKARHHPHRYIAPQSCTLVPVASLWELCSPHALRSRAVPRDTIVDALHADAEVAAPRNDHDNRAAVAESQ